jgi:hypothetical protein
MVSAMPPPPGGGDPLAYGQIVQALVAESLHLIGREGRVVNHLGGELEARARAGGRHFDPAEVASGASAWRRAEALEAPRAEWRRSDPVPSERARAARTWRRPLRGFIDRAVLDDEGADQRRLPDGP